MSISTESRKPTETTGGKLLRNWGRRAKLPMGKRVFSRMLGTAIPYTGSIKARVEHLEPSHAVVVLPDRRCVRNHLNSVHAIAMANLAGHRKIKHQPPSLCHTTTLKKPAALAYHRSIFLALGVPTTKRLAAARGLRGGDSLAPVSRAWPPGDTESYR